MKKNSYLFASNADKALYLNTLLLTVESIVYF